MKNGVSLTQFLLTLKPSKLSSQLVESSLRLEQILLNLIDPVVDRGDGLNLDISSGLGAPISEAQLRIDLI